MYKSSTWFGNVNTMIMENEYKTMKIPPMNKIDLPREFEVNVSSAYITKVIKSDPRYVKEIRKQDNKINRNKMNRLLIHKICFFLIPLY